MAGVEVRAVQRHIRMSPQKVRLVLHEKGLKFDEVRLDLGRKD